MNPTIFLSYSKTKSYDRDLTTHLISEIRNCLTSRRWDVHDPLAEEGGDVEGIREKVSSHLYNSDALFADCTMAVPNVMFEIGFARALRYPIVFFVNRDAFSSDEDSGHIWNLLAFVLIDLFLLTWAIEYFEYSSKIKDYSKRRLFRSISMLFWTPSRPE